MLTPKYPGDHVLDEGLNKAGAKIILDELYGLFYGCIAATYPVMPSAYMPLIFGEEGMRIAPLGEANQILGHMMALWNHLVARDPLTFPHQAVAGDLGGLRDKIARLRGRVKYFVRGLDLGGTNPDRDLSEDGLSAIQSLAEGEGWLEKIDELILQDKGQSEDLVKTAGMVDQLEDVLSDCMARIIAGLKESRMRAVREMREQAVPEPPEIRQVPKIGRNAPCPCGSGRKYKQCCGRH
ncbi:MAG: SEC-C metal-binding domain-containing protein [Candidatus Methylomirabilales bacterium]